MKTFLRATALIILLCAAAAGSLAEPSIIFLVRHAERADAGGAPQKDPSLSQIGQARAEALAQTLKDSGIRYIFVTEFRRTQQTAQPLASALKIPLTTVVAEETAALVGQIQKADGAVLVVGHSNTIPEIIRALGLKQPVKIGESSYDDLFLVIPGAHPQLYRLHDR